VRARRFVGAMFLLSGVAGWLSLDKARDDTVKRVVRQLPRSPRACRGAAAHPGGALVWRGFWGIYSCVYVETETKIARYGNSLTVRLPVGVARELDVRDGDRVVLRTVASGVVIERPKRGRLAARLATVREREPEAAAGRVVGAEAIE
jgi:antitoxin component of MazEF toxin-antitoxin module